MLKVEQLGCRFGQQWALEDISFELPQGQVLAVLGPSGCGKSSLLKVIAGMQQPASGRVELQHQLLADQRFSMAIEKRPINMVFQDYALWPHMKVEQIIGYGLFRLSAAAKRAKVAELPADRLRIMPDSGQPTEQDNALIGEVTQSLFEGQNWRVRLQLAGANLSIICQQPFAKGSKLRVHCPAEHALLFASQ